MLMDISVVGITAFFLELVFPLEELLKQPL